jgi:hypothetical protein
VGAGAAAGAAGGAAEGAAAGAAAAAAAAAAGAGKQSTLSPPFFYFLRQLCKFTYRFE